MSESCVGWEMYCFGSVQWYMGLVRARGAVGRAEKPRMDGNDSYLRCCKTMSSKCCVTSLPEEIGACRECCARQSRPEQTSDASRMLVEIVARSCSRKATRRCRRDQQGRGEVQRPTHHVEGVD